MYRGKKSHKDDKIANKIIIKKNNANPLKTTWTANKWKNRILNKLVTFVQLTGVIEQAVVLRHHGHSGSNGLLGYVGNIHAVYEDRTAVYLEHTCDEL